MKRNNSLFILSSPLQSVVCHVLWGKGVHSDKPTVMNSVKTPTKMEVMCSSHRAQGGLWAPEDPGELCLDSWTG